MKKIAYAMILGILILGSASQAKAAWNTHPSDCPLPLSIGNYTTGDGIQNGSNGCWTKSNISASAGQTINIAVFYDNTNNTSAQNVVIRLNQSPAGSMTSANSMYSFSGNLSSSAGNLNLGSVSANLSSAQTLTFGQAQWFRQGSSSGMSLPNGQTGYEAFSNGVNLGTIADGDWGTVIFSFSIGSNGNGNGNPNLSQCSITSFTANGQTSLNLNNSYNNNTPVTLSWNTFNCTSVNVSGPNFSSTNSNGNREVYPQNGTNTYTITAYGSNGTQTQSVYVYNNNNGNNPSVQTGSPTNVSTNSATLTGSASGNGSTVNSWIEFPCYGSQYGNQYSQSYSNLSTTVYSLSPNTTYTYCAAAQGNNNGQIIRGNQVTFTTTGTSGPIYNNNVVTLVATNTTTSSATLNGLLTNSNNSNTANTYFEYGTTVNLGSRTASRTISGNATTFNDIVSGLAPNTIYYFRAVSDGSGGTSRGAIEIFRTLGGATANQVIVTGTTVVGTNSPILLKIENRFESIGVGDSIDYAVTYKNISKLTLTKAVLQVIAPKGITLTNASRGTYSADTNTLTVQLDTLAPGDTGVVYIQGRLDSIPSSTAKIVTTAILVYTTPANAQENAIAYVLNTPKDGSLLGAAALFGGFFPNSLVGWLIIIILILALLLLARRYQRRPVVSQSPYQAHTPDNLPMDHH